uniref:TctD-like protein n=1 Tax=Dipterosiphonia australica TaxID=2007208 RepID=A0A1Z1MLD7_9FLOR|nr:hypothetical protein [Dipterosiphonia australica]ARW66920.1 hypothetical protein [Dipterosiphonia australica]
MKKILLVDDDQKLCYLLSSYLISFNFDVDSEYSIRNALVYIREYCPDLVISDIMMKDLDGYDFIKFLKLDNLFNHIPVIFLTAKGMTNDRIKGYNLGCHAYLTKPFDPRELVAIIDNIFNYTNLLHRNVVLHQKKSTAISQSFNPFNFTDREKSVLIFVLKGYMNKEIAISLNVSTRNIENYVSRLLIKTNTRNRVELIKLLINSI